MGQIDQILLHLSFHHKGTKGKFFFLVNKSHQIDHIILLIIDGSGQVRIFYAKAKNE